jgi:tetratricopeptide (TPR) repeat protein
MKWTKHIIEKFGSLRMRNGQWSMVNGQWLIVALLLLSGCQSIEQLTIDYMEPAKVSFPDELKKVGIVNNVPEDLPNRLARSFTDTPNMESGGLSHTTNYYNGLTSYAMESLAHAIADEEYFEQVVICDSVLRANDTQLQAGGLTMDEVNYLINYLDVDVLLSLESLQMREVRDLLYSPDFGLYVGAVNVAVRPILNIYLPGRDSQVATINMTDSIYWDEVGNSITYVKNHLINQEEMLKQASDYAGALPVKNLLPHWESADRFFFTNGNLKVRDGVVYARENQWEKAAELWEQAYAGTKSKKKQFYAAYNLALAYEMMDDIEKSFQWVSTALEKSQGNATNQFLAQQYYKELQKRHSNVAILDAQLNRFKE